MDINGPARHVGKVPVAEVEQKYPVLIAGIIPGSHQEPSASRAVV
jgi:hypothetical protein